LSLKNDFADLFSMGPVLGDASWVQTQLSDELLGDYGTSVCKRSFFKELVGQSNCFADVLLVPLRLL